MFIYLNLPVTHLPTYLTTYYDLSIYDPEKSLSPRIPEKSADETARIAQMVQNNFLFVKLDEHQKGLMYRMMRSRDVKAGECMCVGVCVDVLVGLCIGVHVYGCVGSKYVE